MREWSTKLVDLIEDGFFDKEALEKLAVDLINWHEEEDVKRFMEVNGFVQLFEELEDES